MRVFIYKKRKLRRIFIIFISVAILIAMGARIISLFYTLSQSKARFEATNAINKVISSHIDRDLYSGIVIKEYDQNGNIAAVSTDIALVNRLQGEISAQLMEKLKENTQYYITLSLANILGMRTISGVGPKIPVKIAPSPNISVKFEDSFVSAGINQTKFAVNLIIEVNMLVSAAPVRSNVTVNRTVPVAQVVLVGNVPGTYANFGDYSSRISTN